MKRIVLFSLIFLGPFFSKAKDFPKIYGCFCEGGLILGLVNKDDELRIENKKIRIFDNGEFIYAFGRKFDEKITIEFNGSKKIIEVENKNYKIEKIDGLPINKVQPNKKDIAKIQDDQKKIKLSKKLGFQEKLFDKSFILPAKGRLSGFFGSQRILNSKPRSPHNGIDIAANEGSVIVSPSSGKVKAVALDMFFTGNTLIIDHGLGLISIFAHLKEINVEEGQDVKQGQKIGLVGMTGRATGPHLHWGTYLLNTPVDPLDLVSSNFF